MKTFQSKTWYIFILLFIILSCRKEDTKPIDPVLEIEKHIEYLKEYYKKINTKVTEKEIQKLYNEDKTASVIHILLMTQGKSDSAKIEIRKKMEVILERAKQGEDFAKLVEEYSEDPGSKNNGGLYKDFGRGDMVKPFEDAAFSVPIGEISDIIETRFGYHILKVIDRKKETQPLEKVQQQIESD